MWRDKTETAGRGPYPALVRKRSAALLALALGALGCLAEAAAVEAPKACHEATRQILCDGAGSACEEVDVFVVPDAWHGLAQCLRGLRNIWSAHGPDAPVPMNGRPVAVADLVAHQIQWTMTRPHVRFLDRDDSELPHGRVIGNGFQLLQPPVTALLLNDIGQPYNAMGQSGLAYFLYQFALLATRSPQTADAAPTYRALGGASIHGVLLPVARGGLATSRPCEIDPELACTWYHSVTRRDRETEVGATLNQHLHAVRDMMLIKGVIESQRWTDLDAQIAGGLFAGINQLFDQPAHRRAGTPPALSDFLSAPVGSARVRWSYYGFSPTESKGYFLGTKGRDCNYHVHSMELLGNIINHVAELKNSATFPIKLMKRCGGEFHELYKAVATRTSSNLPGSPWSSNDPARDYSCPRLEMEGNNIIELYQDTFKSCNPADANW